MQAGAIEQLIELDAGRGPPNFLQRHQIGVDPAEPLVQDPDAPGLAFIVLDIEGP